MGIISSLIGAAQDAAHMAFDANQSKLAYERSLQADSTKYQRQVADMQAAGLNPMMAVSAGAGSVQSPAASSSPAANVGALLQQSQQLDVQKELAEANIKKTNAETDKIVSETEGQDLENALFRDTADIKKVLLGDEHDRNQWEKEIGLRGVSVKEDNQRMLERNAEHYNDFLDKQSELFGEQIKSEDLKRELYRANAREANMNAGYKAAMLAVDKEYRTAVTESEKAQAKLLSIEARIKNGIYTPSYIAAICKDAQAMADYHVIMKQYYQGDYSAASKTLQKVFEEGERLGRNYGMINLSADSMNPAGIIPALQ